MEHFKIPMTPRQIKALQARLFDVSPDSSDDCLADDLCIGYVTGQSSPEDVARVKSHLDTCLECTAEVERIRAGFKAWREDKGQQRLAQMRARLLTAAWHEAKGRATDTRMPAAWVSKVAGTPFLQEAPPALGTIPATLLRGDQEIGSSVMITRKPVIKDGCLYIRLRVSPTDFHPGERLDLWLTHRTQQTDRTIIDSPMTIDPTEESLLAFKLPQDLQTAWQDIGQRKWEEFPAWHFFVHPYAIPDKAGEAQ